MSLLGLSDYSICANKGGDNDGNRVASLNVGAPDYHLVLEIRSDDLDKLPKVRGANWDERTTLKIGTVHLSPAFWSMKDDELSILVGHDDESWSIAFTLPSSLLDTMIQELEPLRPFLQAGRQTS